MRKLLEALQSFEDYAPLSNARYANSLENGSMRKDSLTSLKKGIRAFDIEKSWSPRNEMKRTRRREGEED